MLIMGIVDLLADHYAEEYEVKVVLRQVCKEFHKLFALRKSTHASRAFMRGLICHIHMLPPPWCRKIVTTKTTNTTICISTATGKYWRTLEARMTGPNQILLEWKSWKARYTIELRNMQVQRHAGGMLRGDLVRTNLLTGCVTSMPFEVCTLHTSYVLLLAALQEKEDAGH